MDAYRIGDTILAPRRVEGPDLVGDGWERLQPGHHEYGMWDSWLKATDEDDDGELDDDSAALLTALEHLAKERETTAAGDDGTGAGLTNTADRRVRAEFDSGKHQRVPKGQPGAGRFMTMVDRLQAAIKEHLDSGSEGHPFEEFNREQLRRVAKERGIELKRGESRDSIAEKLLTQLRDGAGAEEGSTVKKGAPPKPTRTPKADPEPISGKKALGAAPLEFGEFEFDRGADGDLANELDPSSLDFYRSDGYREVNGYLRNPAPSRDPDGELKATVSAMDFAMGHSRLTQPILVHRGVGDLKKMLPGVHTGRSLVGLEYAEDAFTSTTVDPRVAEGFGIGTVMLNIRVPKGVGAVQLSRYYDGQIKDGLPVGASRELDYEAEMLLERGLRFRVVDDQTIDGVRQLGVEVVPA